MIGRLLSKNQAALLRALFTDPKRSFYMQELGRILGKKPGTFQRALNSLAGDGILTSEYKANVRYFRANMAHPFYPELRKMVEKTNGPEKILRELAVSIPAIKAAWIYGSLAKGTARPDSDIDLMIVGSPEAEKDLLKKLPALEKKLLREINYRLFSPKEYLAKKKRRDPFLEEVLAAPVLRLKGGPDAV